MFAGTQVGTVILWCASRAPRLPFPASFERPPWQRAWRRRRAALPATIALRFPDRNRRAPWSATSSLTCAATRGTNSRATGEATQSFGILVPLCFDWSRFYAHMTTTTTTTTRKFIASRITEPAFTLLFMTAACICWRFKFLICCSRCVYLHILQNMARALLFSEWFAARVPAFSGRSLQWHLA